MAVVNTMSTTETNLRADPIVVANVRHQHGRLRVKSETVAVAAADDDNSIYQFFRVGSGDSIKSIKLYNDLITGGVDYDLGLYPTDGTVLADAVDADLYCDDVDMAIIHPAIPPVSANNDGLELRFGDSTTSAIQDINNRVWEDLGLAADPFLEYVLTLTANTVGSAAGDITLVMLYTSGD